VLSSLPSAPTFYDLAREPFTLGAVDALRSLQRASMQFLALSVDVS
jgi:hypothetical protein